MQIPNVKIVIVGFVAMSLFACKKDFSNSASFSGLLNTMYYDSDTTDNMQYSDTVYYEYNSNAQIADIKHFRNNGSYYHKQYTYANNNQIIVNEYDKFFLLSNSTLFINSSNTVDSSYKLSYATPSSVSASSRKYFYNSNHQIDSILTYYRNNLSVMTKATTFVFSYNSIGDIEQVITKDPNSSLVSNKINYTFYNIDDQRRPLSNFIEEDSFLGYIQQRKKLINTYTFLQYSNGVVTSTYQPKSEYFLKNGLVETEKSYVLIGPDFKSKTRYTYY